MAYSDDDVQHGQGKFLKATADIILPRQQAEMWLELRKLHKKSTMPCWASCLLVSDCGCSVGWSRVDRDMLPCLRPGNSYLILQQGKAKLAKGALLPVFARHWYRGGGSLLSPNGGGWYVAPVGWQRPLCQYMLGCLDCCTIVLMMVQNAGARTLQKHML